MTTFRGSAFSNNDLLITQGEFAVSDEEPVVISTLLGSCVSVCLWDEVAGVGGMNHLLLARGKSTTAEFNLAGVAEMECLINAIIKLGGRRDRLQAKVFGGSNMLGTETGVGKANADFALDFLSQEGIAIRGESLGGTIARTIRFIPKTGKAGMKFVKDVTSQTQEPAKKKLLRTGNELELF
jgi:chemotaxis protein CheD